MNGYISGLIYTSAFCAVCLALTPKGRVKSVVSFACGIAMITALFSPLIGLDFSDYSETLAGYKEEAEKIANEGVNSTDKLNRLYIEEQCESYILDKAESLRVYVREVNVYLEWSDKGFWYPVSAEITAECSDSAQKQLSAYIESELGIERSKQNWSETNEKPQVA